jgi:hypothetical protein
MAGVMVAYMQEGNELFFLYMRKGKEKRRIGFNNDNVNVAAKDEIPSPENLNTVSVYLLYYHQND